MVGGGIIIHGTHILNTVRPLHPEVNNEDIPLQLSYFLRKGPFEIVLPSKHGKTCIYFGIVMHVRGGEGLARKVSVPITEIFVKHRNEAPLLAVEGATFNIIYS